MQPAFVIHWFRFPLNFFLCWVVCAGLLCSFFNAFVCFVALLCDWPLCLPSLLQPQSSLSCCLIVRTPNPYTGCSAAAPPGQVLPFCLFFVSGKFSVPEFLKKGGHSLRPVVFVSYSILRFLPMNISRVIFFPYINTSSFSMLKLTFWLKWQFPRKT